MRGLGSAVVVAWEDEPGQKRLVGYVVWRGGHEGSVGELRGYLQGKLPEYMVPGLFVVMDKLPLTANGKLDRKALPRPEGRAAGTGDEMIEPRTPEEELVAGLWRQVLKLKEVGIDDNFFELGGHSLLMVQVWQHLRQRLKWELTLRELFQQPTIRQTAVLITNVLARRIMDSFEAIEDEWRRIELSAETIPHGRPRALENPRAILVTGATGFLGPYLVRELLAQTCAKMYCLIRGKDIGEASARLSSQLIARGISRDAILQRVIAVRGDLSESGLGLSTKDYRELARKIDSIYHNGALVNFVWPFSRLRAANVGATETLLQFACKGNPKRFHYISTLGVFGGHGLNTAEIEATETVSLDSGYEQSKWAAEKLVRTAKQRGLPTVIYRPGMITGDTRGGAWNRGDIISRLIHGCIQLGMVPAEFSKSPYIINWAPVDYVSKAIVTVSLNRKAFRRPAFHIINP